MKYDSGFFDYVDSGAIRSARAIVGRLFPLLRPGSVLDVGCGRGGWLGAWKAAGCADIQGIDGDYVDREKLYIPRENFLPANLAMPFDLGRRFDLVQCLEVAEHIEPARADGLIDSIVHHGDIVLFSAAVPGQGGTQHINERPLEYWRDLFASHGFAAFDAVRPDAHTDSRIEPWYRFNSILYANPAGQAALPDSIEATRVADGAPFADLGNRAWRLRRAIFRHMPLGLVDRAALVNARLRRWQSAAP